MYPSFVAICFAAVFLPSIFSSAHAKNFTVSKASVEKYMVQLSNMRDTVYHEFHVKLHKRVAEKVRKGLKKLLITRDDRDFYKYQPYGNGLILAFNAFRLSEWYRLLAKKISTTNQIDCTVKKPEPVLDTTQESGNTCVPTAVTDDCLQNLQIKAKDLLLELLNLSKIKSHKKVNKALRKFKNQYKKQLKLKKGKKFASKFASICGVFNNRIREALTQFA